MVYIEICRQHRKSFLISAWHRPPNSNANLFDSFEFKHSLKNVTKNIRTRLF